MPFSITSITLASWMSIPPARNTTLPTTPANRKATTATANTTFWRTTRKIRLLKAYGLGHPLKVIGHQGNVCSLDGHFGSGATHRDADVGGC